MNDIFFTTFGVIFFFSACDSLSWGKNCLKKCECLQGTCNNTKGCVCNTGYEGEKCVTEINYCKNDTCDSTSTCKSFIGYYECECKEGYYNATPKTGNCIRKLTF